MRILRGILLAYSYLFHTVLALAVLLMTVVVKSSNMEAGFRLGYVPFRGEELVAVLMYSAIIGLITIILAVTRIFPYAFPVYALIVLVQGVRWFLLGSSTYSGQDEFRGALWLLVGMFGAFLSSLIVLRPRRDRV